MENLNLRKSIFLANLSQQLVPTKGTQHFTATEEEFEQLQKSLDCELIIIEDANLQKFDQDLAKAITDNLQKGFGGISDDIEKAQRDRSKLVQVSITDKNGHKRKVWVKPGDAKAAMSGGKKGEEKSEPKGRQNKIQKYAEMYKTKSDVMRLPLKKILEIADDMGMPEGKFAARKFVLDKLKL